MNKFILSLAVIFFSLNSYADKVGIFIILSKQRALLSHADIIANNIANAETPGFKESKIIESPYKVQFNNFQPLEYDNDISTFQNMSDGTLMATENPFSFAIMGDGFFIIKTKNGERFSRAGNFTLNQSNQLVTINGDHVLNNGNTEITFPANTKNLLVNEDGEIIVDGTSIGQIGIAYFLNNQDLMQEGNNLYKGRNNTSFRIQTDTTKFKVVQGFLESSNVNKIAELTQLMEVQRDLGYISNLINRHQEVDRTTVTRLGKE